MKRIIAMFLSTVLILMMSAFAFAADYEVFIDEPDSDFELESWDDTFFVSGYVVANSGDIINWLKVTIKGDDDGEAFSKTFIIDDSDFDVDGDEYNFNFDIENPELWGIDEEDDYDITVTARIEDEEGDRSNISETMSDINIRFDKEMDYGAQLTMPLEDVVITDWDDPILIKGWVKALDEDDQLESVIVEIDGPDYEGDEFFEVFDEDDDDEWDFEDDFEFEIDDWIVDEDFDDETFTITLTAVINPVGNFDEDDYSYFDEDDDVIILTNSVEVEILFDEDYDDDDEDDDDNDEVMDNYPAAPAIANKLLKAEGYANRYKGTNLISAVSKKMGPNTDFNGVSKLDAVKYEQEIWNFLDDLIDDLDMDAPPAPGNSDNKGKGKDKDK